MATKKLSQSKSIWYHVISALAVLTTALLADESIKQELTGTMLVGLYIVDKYISSYLRTISDKKIEMPKVLKKKKPKSNLDILDEHESMYK